MTQSRDKIEKKLKELNEIRHIYKRDFDIVEKNFKEGKISKENFEKKKIKYEKRKEKIRNKINDIEGKLVHPVE